MLENVAPGLDEKIKFRIEHNRTMEKLYDFFDSETKPMSPREFLIFWVSLTQKEVSRFSAQLP